MIQKKACERGGMSTVQVTFTLPASIWADVIHLVGDFNDWNRDSHPLTRDRMGHWVIAVLLEPNRAYQFRYLIDCRHWTNDDNADAYVRNFTGSDNSIVITDLTFEKHLND